MKPEFIAPSIQNYQTYLQELQDEAQANPDKKIGFIQLHACHGYNNNGKQFVAINKFDPQK